MALIRRSRTGCFTCRSRKKKCNEVRPICSGCRRNDLECRWPAPVSSAKRPREGNIKPTATALQAGLSKTLTPFASGTVILRPRPASFSHSAPSPKENGIAEVTTGEAAPATSSTQRGHSFSALRPADHFFDIADPAPVLDTIIVEANGVESYSRFSTAMDPQEVDPSSPVPSKYYSELSPSSTSQVSSSSPSSSSSPPPTVVIPPNGVVGSGVSAITNLDDVPFDPSPDQTHSLQDLQLCLTKPLSLFPHHGKYSPDLLSFYLDRTANCMGNGSTDSNPFITKLIPLAFSHPLLLQLIMAQSAVHRQMSKDRHPSDEVAIRSYSDSLRYFRTVVDGYVSGREENALILTVGSLILSLTEVARGDSHGTTFDHIGAAKSLLPRLLTSPRRDLSDDLRAFLVEYYTHMSSLSMISMGAHHTAQPLPDPDMERLATDLIEKHYIGQLCGCWLELLVLIPKIFILGKKKMVSESNGQSYRHSPDDITNFSFLQSQRLAFFPHPSANPDTALAGLVFKQAVLLYLWTILASPHHKNDDNAMLYNLIQGAVVEALCLLGQIRDSSRINTSLCWPLVVIGCCLSDLNAQQVLRCRLQTMLETIALGNMRETLSVLEHVWAQPLEDRNPWALCNTMQEHQILISFA
ncbi:hypothetical protein V496_09169 [Pseudogymnoascus sp. VKM F-4515 (FW-2607)]|nr:hypothetical protein V496_09169 [Pseudogymnoascus sp. VKM F-4515 (FW-2607)]